MVPNLGTMAFTRKKTYKRKDGEVSTYYYRVENNWVDGQSRQKVLEYMGDSPNRREIRVDTSTAGELAKALFSQEPTPEEISEILVVLGIRVDEEPRRVSLVYDPPLGKLTLVVE